MKEISSKIKEAPIVGNFDVIRSKQIEVVDARGHTRAFIGTIDDEALFLLCDGHGLRTLECRVRQDGGAELRLIRDGAVTRFAAALTETDRVVLSLLDPDGKAVYTVEVDQHGKITKS